MKILFVVPPFYEPTNPAIGVSNLQAIAKQMGHKSRILYENIYLLESLPMPVYHFITNNPASMTLLPGDFIYALLRIPESEREGAIDRYLREVVAEYLLDHPRILQAYKDFFLKAVPVVEEAGIRTIGRIAKEDPDIVGFTIGAYQLHAGLYLAGKVKEAFPEKQIWFGGSYCTGSVGLKLMEYFPQIDVIFTGESEKSLEAMLKSMENGNSSGLIPGIITREMSRWGEEYPKESLCPEMVEDLDELPVPDYGDYMEVLRAVEAVKEIKPYLLMESSRGCWWAQKSPCYFCGLNMQTKKYRTKSAGRVLEEMTGHMEQYGVSWFVMVDNVLNQQFFKDLFPFLKDRFKELKIFYEVRCNLNKEELGMLHASGVSLIQAGVEALDDELLELLHKGTHACQNLRMVKWCEELDIHIIYNFLYAIPGESKDAYRRVLSLMKDIHHLRPPNPTRVHLDRDSVYDLDSGRFGVIKKETNPASVTLCFPEPYIDPMQIVHNYSNGIKDLDPGLPILWGEFIDAIWAWHEDYYKECKELSYRIAEGHVHICDNRFSAEKQRYALDPIESAVFLYCDAGHGKEAILKNITQFSPEEILAALDRLCEKKLVCLLSGRFISLAVKEREGKETGHRTKKNFKSEGYPGLLELPEFSKDFPWIYKSSANFFGFKYRHKHLFDRN